TNCPTTSSTNGSSNPPTLGAPSAAPSTNPPGTNSTRNQMKNPSNPPFGVQQRSATQLPLSCAHRTLSPTHAPHSPTSFSPHLNPRLICLLRNYPRTRLT